MERTGRRWVVAVSVLLLTVVALAFTGAPSAASVAPDPASETVLVPAAAMPPDPAAESVPIPAGATASGARPGAAPMSVASPPPPWPVPGGAAAPARPWVWPLSPPPVVVARFDPPEVVWGAGHRGVDLAATVGQDVLAPASGRVSFSGVVVDRGVLVIETSAGLRTTLEPVTDGLAVGTAVTAGQPVGHVEAGPGHCAPATCLHWGVLRGETYLDPLTLVAPVRVVLLPMWPP